ncbi:MAG: hypothetical protein WC858_02535 [Parcubacteria group bacterium]|jgi:hypothetical protein
MEKIKSLLSLMVHDGKIKDRFTIAFIKALHKAVYKLMNSAEGLGEEEKEISPLERRKKIVDDEEDATYEKSLRLLAKLRPGYEKYLPERGKKRKSLELSNLLKRRMRLAVWVGTGNEIPFRELNKATLKTLLKKKGYFYQRDKLRWHDRSGRLVGKDLFEALVDLEKNEPVDRSRLTIEF